MALSIAIGGDVHELAEPKLREFGRITNAQNGESAKLNSRQRYRVNAVMI